MRVRESFQHKLVSVCDEALLGKTLIDDKIKFNVSKEFYGGDLVDIKICIEQIKKATMANMVGNDTIKAAITAGLIHEKAILHIDGHPHAQWMKF